MNDVKQPLVSCIMPTYNRRAFIPYAIKYFLRQDYKNKELIIIDDGDDKVSDIIPDVAGIRYFYLDKKLTLGAKLNLACSYAGGSIIANWDDDDWYASIRLSYQIDSLQNGDFDICGINKLFYYDLRNKCAYQYIYPPDQRTWLIGSSLCYTKEFWKTNNFEDVNVGMDALFVWRASQVGVKVLSDSCMSVHMIHDSNVSPKKTEGKWWNKYPSEEINKMMGADWQHYQNGNFKIVEEPVIKASNTKPSKSNSGKQFKNVHACLVHENEDCIIDLVRNLHYHDPASTILLYNGGENTELFKSDFPYKKFNAVLHPDPVPIKHGYLHNFALDCMQFALENFSFDSFTAVDSDQLFIQPGYTEFISEFFSTQSNTGMLSSKPALLTRENSAPDNYEVWPALQALKEYELWEPFLSSFPDGKNKFVHWTFWPSSVFTADAAKDVVKLSKENKLLGEIIKKSKIWATEEVILPTLVSLLGYEIALNPCSYDFVKYRKSFTPEELNTAFNKADAYWIHPIERKYEDALRKHTREQFNHYTLKKHETLPAEYVSPDLFLRTSLIEKIKRVEGWLDDKEAELLINITFQLCKDFPLPHSIVEVGSYHGKSTILFGSVIKEFYVGGKVYAIDPHDGKLGAVDQGLLLVPPSYEIFKQNIQDADLCDVVEIIKDNAGNVKWQKPISLLLIDGLHDYPNVARDFYHFSEWITPGGMVAFHDYADYFPGVKALVNELLGTSEYQQISKVESLIVLKKL